MLLSQRSFLIGGALAAAIDFVSLAPTTTAWAQSISDQEAGEIAQEAYFAR